jgi:putative restriction endonuclease
LRPGTTSATIAAVEDEHDRRLRVAAIEHVRELSRRYDDVVPLDVLREGFRFDGRRISLNTFNSGIFRPKELHGPAALSVVTAPPKGNRPAPYEDSFDENAGVFDYRFREAHQPTPAALAAAQRDNNTLVEAHRRSVPLIYFRGVTPGQYVPLAPAFVTAIDLVQRLAHLEIGLPIRDLVGTGPASTEETRRYATREAAYRLHQHRFRQAVLRAYDRRCTICRLKEVSLLQAAHIIEDRDVGGEATVVNGLSLCAIHHLAYDRNLLGIDPDGVVHIHRRLLDEVDGPMLANGLQHFHGAPILLPRRVDERPDRERLSRRFEGFRRAG